MLIPQNTKILITGSTGFIGRNLKEYFANKYTLLTPTHEELDLTNNQAVYDYFGIYQPDIIIHCACKENPPCLKENLQMFFNLAGFKKKMIYFGSGAEGRKDDYGYSKFVMNEYTKVSTHISNLCLYGVYGKYEDWKRRFISHCIYCKMRGTTVKIHADKLFNYLYIDDLCRTVDMFMGNPYGEGAYTITSSTNHKLSQIAKMVGVKYKILKDTNTQYTPSRQEINLGYLGFTSLEDGIKNLEEYYKKNGFKKEFV